MAGGPYKRAAGWQIRWREGGQFQSETLNSEADALMFKALVEQAGNRWPKDAAGNPWVSGRGFAVDADDGPKGTPFLPYADRRIESRVRSGRLGIGMAKKYATFARTIAGSMAVAPLERLRTAKEAMTDAGF